MITRLVFLLIFGLAIYNARSQSIGKQILSSSGEKKINQGVTLNFTLGELVIENFKELSLGINTGLFGKINELLVALPNSLREFSLVAKDSKVTLYWNILSDKNTSYYEVQKSVDGMKFLTEGIIKPFVNTSINNQYELTDNDFYEKSYYRLKIVSVDGNYKFSNVLTASPTYYSSRFSVYPNPTDKFINLNIILREPDAAYVSIINQIGLTLIKKTYILAKGQNVISINLNSLSTGVYIINIVTKEKQASQSIFKL